MPCEQTKTAKKGEEDQEQERKAFDKTGFSIYNKSTSAFGKWDTELPDATELF